eukprot:12816661-Alexandrium_andersonii.AAC.1
MSPPRRARSDQSRYVERTADLNRRRPRSSQLHASRGLGRQLKRASRATARSGRAVCQPGQ